MSNRCLLIVLLAAVGCSCASVDNNGGTTRMKGYGPGEQEYGYLTIRDGADVFFWLYYAQTEEDFQTRPTVVFLSGGPGVSSSGVGNFGQVGPQFVNGTARAASWAKYVNVLYVDQPVGTGCSMAYNDTVFQKENIPNGDDLTKLFITFLNFYPRMRFTKFYFYAEGFGGKNMVELSYQLDVAIREQRIAMDFRGIILAGPWISPADIIGSWPKFLQDKKLVSQSGYNNVNSATNLVLQAIADKNWPYATSLWLELLDVIDEETDGVDIMNINKKATKRAGSNKPAFFSYSDIEENGELQDLMNSDVRMALDLFPEVTYDGNQRGVFNAFRSDFLFPVINVISDLLRDSPLEITLLTGGLDLLAATPGTEKWVNGMTWPGSDEWHQAPREPLVVNGVTAGSSQHYGNFTIYWIDQAGHMIPRDQPEVGLELLRRFSHYDD